MCAVQELVACAAVRCLHRALRAAAPALRALRDCGAARRRGVRRLHARAAACVCAVAAVDYAPPWDDLVRRQFDAALDLADALAPAYF
jgi:hypothetical protein